MKRRRPKPANFDYDFTNLAVEVTGDALYLINGGVQIENSVAAQANAQVGDTVTNSRGETHTLTQGDINWAKDQIGSSGQNTGSSSPSSQPTPSSSSAGSSSVSSASGDDKWVLDWTNGQWIALEGATLYGKYGENWRERSGFTRDPRTLQVGERVGPVRWETYPADAVQGVHINCFPDIWEDAIEVDENGNPLKTNLHIGAENITRKENTFYIGAHGSSEKMRDANKIGIKFETLLAAIENNPEFVPGMDIVLISCSTGDNSSGECLAKNLSQVYSGSRVEGPNDALRLAISGYYWVDFGGTFCSFLDEQK